MNQEPQLSRLSKAFQASPSEAVLRSDCPPPEHLWHGVRGELDPAEFRQIVLHLGDCPVCTEAWLLAERLEDGAAEEGEVVPFPVGSKDRSWWSHNRWLGLVAVLALVLGSSLVFREAPFRSSNSQTVPVRGTMVEGIKLISGETLPRENFLLRWEGPTGEGITYHLSVIPRGSMSVLVDQQDLREHQYRLSPEKLQSLASGTELEIHLQARHPFEGNLASKTFTVTLQ